jgi:hypothetical protein
VYERAADGVFGLVGYWSSVPPQGSPKWQGETTCAYAPDRRSHDDQARASVGGSATPEAWRSRRPAGGYGPVDGCRGSRVESRRPGGLHPTQEPTFHTVHEAARIRVDAATIYRSIRAGSFPAIRIRSCTT